MTTSNIMASLAPPIPYVIDQHGSEASVLRAIRSNLVRAPHIGLSLLARHDDRIAAHLDGLIVAGAIGSNLCMSQLEEFGVGNLFSATALAITEKNAAHLDALFLRVATAPGVIAGLTSAFGWVSAQQLQGTVSQLLASPSPLRRRVGIAACAMHMVDAGPALVAGLGDADAALRERALQLLLMVIDLPRAHELLRLLARNPQDIRLLIRGTGTVGDPVYVPWLIKQMDDLKLTRLAGESFSLITGLDLAYLDLEVKPPENFESGPTDDPEDEDVSLDEDGDLPWPDAAKTRAWWDAHAAQFTNGSRYFMGAPLSPAHCVQVLKDGCQRQRIAAALHRCLLQPGTKLFNCAAPAWRQKRWLETLA